MTDGYSMQQTTLRKRIVVSGVGVHSGLPVSLSILPASADTGIVFRRVDASDHTIPVAIEFLHATDSCTTIADAGVSVATIEHLMAAFSGLGVDNAVVEINGPEVPMMDGSAAAFVSRIERAGILVLAAGRRFIKVLRPVRVENGAAFGELTPYDGRRFEIDIEFASPVIGRQAFILDLDAKSFRRDLAQARTFGFLKDVEMIRARGLAKGASLENTVVIGDDAVVNPEGLRFSDEFVRHKALDAVGDLALAGAPILGAYRSYRGGHKLNAAVVAALLADKTAWTYVEGVPARRPDSVPAHLAAAAFGPDKS